MIRHLRPAVAATACCLFLLSAGARAAELVPVFDTTLLLGQVLQDGNQSSWQGNAALQMTPAVKFNDNWGLIPTYSGEYDGTKNVTDLGNGGQLFQAEMSHSLLLRGIYKNGNLKIKPNAGYRWDFMRETVGETWGHGLFDYRKPSAGVDAEYDFAPGLRGTAAFDLYAIQFPNYSSLESEVQDTGLGREEAQPHTLDSNNLSWTLGGEAPLPFEGGRAQLSVNLTDRRYPQQHLVVDTGDLVSAKRDDTIWSGAGTLLWGKQFLPRVGGVASLQIGETSVRSNQNDYAAEVNVFTPNYYSYDERQIMPKLTAVLGERKVECSLSYLFIRRDYLGRQAQDANGTYLGEAITMNQQTLLFDLAIPISGGFKLIAHGAITNDSSNMKDQTFFLYNYTIANQMAGVSYSF